MNLHNFFHKKLYNCQSNIIQYIQYKFIIHYQQFGNLSKGQYFQSYVGPLNFVFIGKRRKCFYVLIQDIRLLSFKSKEVFSFILGSKLRQKIFVKGQNALQLYYKGVFGEVRGGYLPTLALPWLRPCVVQYYVQCF